jgi:beta-lactamase regulating signal transducer with metallopeptidase domain
VSPVTIGFFRPIVILPVAWREWPAWKQDAVLAHEMAHAARRDPLVQWLALLNRAIFWFHPLAWWLERQLSMLAEQACDDAVLDRGHDAHDYAQCLLTFARAVADAGARINVWGMPMPGTVLSRRIYRILHNSRAPRISSLVSCKMSLKGRWVSHTR